MANAIPEKFTEELYIEKIREFRRPFHVRVPAIGGAPCQWIQNLQGRHNGASEQMKEGLQKVERIKTETFPSIRWKRILTASLGLGVGFGVVFVVVLAGSSLGIGLGVAGLIVGIAAGVFIGNCAAKAEAAKLSLPEYHRTFRIEIRWIKEHLEALNTEIGGLGDGDEKNQLIALKTYFDEWVENAKRIHKPQKAAGY